MAEPSAPTLREFLEGKPKHGPLAMTAADWCLLYPTQAAAALDEACPIIADLLDHCMLAWTSDDPRAVRARAFLSAHSPKPKEKENG